MKEDLDILIRISPQHYHEMLKQAEDRGYQKAQAENARLREALECLVEDIRLTTDVSEPHTIERDCPTIITSASINKAIAALKGGE